MNDYSLASFNTAKEAATKYRDAAIKEVKDNAKDEKGLCQEVRREEEEMSSQHVQHLS